MSRYFPSASSMIFFRMDSGTRLRLTLFLLP